MNLDTIKNLINHVAPVQKAETPAWVFGGARAVLVVLIFLLPLLYDPTVAEVAGDIRWAVLHTTTLLLATALFAAHFLTQKPLQFTTAGALVAGIFLSALAAWPDAVNMFRHWYFFKHITAYCALFFIAFAVWTPTFQRTLLWAMVLPIALNGYLVICQFLNLSDAQLPPPFKWFGLLNFYQQVAAPAGTFANKNLLASWFIFTLPLCAFLLTTTRLNITKIIASLLLALGLVGLAFSRSRASWIALTLTLAAFGLYAALTPAVRQHFSYKSLLVLGAAVVVFVAALCVPSGLKSYNFAASVGQHLGRFSTATQTDLLPRVAYNLNSLHIVKDHPLNGVGLGGFQSIYPLYHDAHIKTPTVGYSMQARPQRVHNDLLQAFVELGIIGGLLQLSLFVYALFMCGRLAKAGQPFAVFAGASITALGINALGDFPLQMPTVPALLMVIIGLVAAQYARTFPTLWQKNIVLPKAVAAVLAGATFVAAVAITVDDSTRRQASQHLKEAMALTVQNIYSPATKKHIDRAHQIYPYHSRLQEFRSTIYTNLSGPLQQSPDKRIEVTTQAAKVVPHSANNLANMAWAYYIKAARLAQHNQTLEGITYAHKVLEISKKMEKVAPFSPHTHGLAGLAYIFLGKNVAAEVALKKALEIDPNFSPAHAGLALLNKK